jgi:6-phosphogluconolactonase
MDVVGGWGARMKKTTLLPEIQIRENAASLAAFAADQFAQIAKDSIAIGGRFIVALAGGSTPRMLYALLTQPVRVAQIDWSRVQIFWGDERCVPPDDPESNFLMARQALLDHVPLPDENVHRIFGELDPDQAARMAELELQQAFPGAVQPRFDLVLLGLGEDGHIASLFPGSPGLDDTGRWVVPVKHTSPPPPLVNRISLTLPVINSAANVLFLVSGSGKARILSEVFQNKHPADPLPAQRVHPGHGRLVWAVDSMAAAEYWKQVKKIS